MKRAVLLFTSYANAFMYIDYHVCVTARLSSSHQYVLRQLTRYLSCYRAPDSTFRLESRLGILE